MMGTSEKKHTMTIRDPAPELRWRCCDNGNGFESKFCLSFLCLLSISLEPWEEYKYTETVLKGRVGQTGGRRHRQRGKNSAEEIQRLPSCIADQLHSYFNGDSCDSAHTVLV